MEKSLLTFDHGTTCSSWNYSGLRLATGSADGTLSIFDTRDEANSTPSFFLTSKSRVLEGSMAKVVWVPPEYGDSVACMGDDGSLSLWEEVAEDTEPAHWRMCKRFEKSSLVVLDTQFGISSTGLKMVVATTNGYVKIYELVDPLDLKSWQLQAEFQNVIEAVSTFGKALCFSASISWNPRKGESQESSFVLGFNSNTSELNSAKVWEFYQAHQRWVPVAELALSDEKEDQVYAVAWAPNVGRPYELIAVATSKEIAIWHLGLNPEQDGRLSQEKVASLSGHQGEESSLMTSGKPQKLDCSSPPHSTWVTKPFAVENTKPDSSMTSGVANGVGYEWHDLSNYWKRWDNSFVAV